MSTASPSERGLRLLSIDGGGIRGLSPLLMLKEILHRIKQKEGLEALPRPCEVFDLAGGTGTGGIIVIMLFRLRMSIDAAIDAYTRLVEQVFSEKKSFLQEGIFKATRLEEAIITVIQGVLPEGYDPRRSLLRNEHGPKCFVCAMPSLNLAHPTLFRSWIPPANPSYDCTIVQAVRATTAAPIFFKAAKFGDPIPQRYLDGVGRCNNPAKHVMQEARSLYPGRLISCLLSLGTGARQVIGLEEPTAFHRVFPTKILKVLQNIAMDCEYRSEEMAKELSGQTTTYIRLNVDHGLQGVLLEDRRSLGRVMTHTGQYLQNNEVGKKVDQLLQVLKPDAPEVLQRHVSVAPTELSPIDRQEHSHGQTSIQRAHHEIYYDELWKYKRGSPLWFPGPSDDLPLSYRSKGFDVGDVGILKTDKSFDFLFNIFHPADHPINDKGVPDPFQLCPFLSYDTVDIKGSCFVSPSISSTEPSGLAFETSTSESKGAILVLPQGAHGKNLETRTITSNYLTLTAVEAWYKYAIEVRRRDVQNGDILLVYGCDKATSWGIATFSNIMGHPTSLKFEMKEDERYHTYGWVCNGTNVEARAGLSVDKDDDGVVKNQCVFLRTINARFSEESWRKIQDNAVQVGHESLLDWKYANGILHDPPTSRSPGFDNLNKSSFNHPSSMLNKCLLENVPNAKVAITSDGDCTALMSEESANLSSRQLFERIEKSYKVCHGDGEVVTVSSVAESETGNSLVLCLTQEPSF